MSQALFPVLLLSTCNDEREHVCGVLLQWSEISPDAGRLSLQAVVRESGLLDDLPRLSYFLPQRHSELVTSAQLPESTLVRYVDNVEPEPLLGPKGGTPSSSLLVKLLGQITSDAETRDIEDTLKHDPQLSVQLLRLVNSVSFSLREPVTSFGQAINILGRRQLQRWLQILMYSGGKSAGKGQPLMVRASLRGALMEQVVKLKGGSSAEQDMAFMTGMFSLLDTLFEAPLAELIEPLHLGEGIGDALLKQQGHLGQLLLLVKTAEMREVKQIEPLLSSLSVEPVVWCKAQVAAMRWTLLLGKES